MRAPRALILSLFFGLSMGCAKACGGPAADDADDAGDAKTKYLAPG